MPDESLHTLSEPISEPTVDPPLPETEAAAASERTETPSDREAAAETPSLDSQSAEILALRGELEAERDRRLRLMAEFDNFRKRTAAELQRLLDLAGERVITRLLPVLDDLRRLSDQTEADPESLKQAVQIISRKLSAFAESEGLQVMNCLGTRFDPELHEAVANHCDPTQPDGVVIAEVEAGYTLHGKVLRHARVVVNHLPEPAEPAPGKDE